MMPDAAVARAATAVSVVPSMSIPDVARRCRLLVAMTVSDDEAALERFIHRHSATAAAPDAALPDAALPDAATRQ
jgi:hypothetical protein